MELTNETRGPAPEGGGAETQAPAAPHGRDWPLAAAIFGVVVALYAVLGYLVYALLT